MAGTFKAELHLVFVVQNFENYSGFFVPPISMPNMEEELRTTAEEQIDEFMNRHKGMFDEFAASSVKSKVLSGDIGEKILNYATETGCNLIVMGTHVLRDLNEFYLALSPTKWLKTHVVQ